jgi:electron transfer flavoprotein beta subunit
MLAELLDLPFVSYASKLDMTANTANIERDIEGGSELLSVDVPFVISCAKGMAEARIPNMKGIMGAKSKPLNVVTPQGIGSLTSVVKYELPPAKGACKMVSADHPEELIRLLHEEAKQI